MSNTTNTPYMNLALPIVGTEVGPAWASEVNTAFSTIDSHTHISGQGLPVPTAGININADLSFNTLYNLTALRSLRVVNQAAALALASDLNCVYVVNGNLYYNDGSANQIQITAAGVVNTSGSGNITGMGGTTAAVTYSNATKVFTFTQSVGVAAKINADLSTSVNYPNVTQSVAGLVSAAGQLLGTNTNDNAASGYVGETLSITRGRSNSISLTTNTTANVCTTASITLTAGDWDVRAFVGFNNSTASGSTFNAAISKTSATLPATNQIANPQGGEVWVSMQVVIQSNSDNTLVIPSYRVTVANATTLPLYLVCSSTFSTGSSGAYGYMEARRIR